MSPQFRPATPSTAVIAWLLNLATRALANALNMPEPLVHSTGVFVYAQVQAAEHRALKSLCPVRVLRRLQAMVRQS
jgi:hypothetical protein